MDESSRRRSALSQGSAQFRAKKSPLKRLPGPSGQQTTTRDSEVYSEYERLATATSPIWQNKILLSGRMHDHQHSANIDSALWIDKVFALARNMGILLPEDDRDQGVPGRFHASNVENKLIAFYIDVAKSHIDFLRSWARTLQWDYIVLDIDISDTACDTCQVFARDIYKRYNVIINFTKSRSHLLSEMQKCSLRSGDG